jgi:uncharacterized damage-inducible protein DinB
VPTEGHHSETTYLCHYIVDTLDRIMACLDGFDEQRLNWRPPVPGGNSLYGLAVHALANTEGDILGHLRGEPVERDRKQELATVASSVAPLLQRWQEQHQALQAFIASLTPADLEREYELLGRGMHTGRDTLFMNLRHISEHLGHMEVIRDLLRATTP